MYMYLQHIQHTINKINRLDSYSSRCLVFMTAKHQLYKQQQHTNLVRMGDPLYKCKQMAFLPADKYKNMYLILYC